MMTRKGQTDEYSLAEIGRELGVSREFVRQRVKACKNPYIKSKRTGRPLIAINLINSLKIIEGFQEPKLPLPIPAGKCACGCGGYVLPSPRTRASRGLKKGDYPAFKKGHNYRAHLRKEPTP